MSVFDLGQDRAGLSALDASTYRWALRASDLTAGGLALVAAVALVPPTRGLFESAFAWHNFLASGFALGALPALTLFLILMEDLRANSLVFHPYDHARRLLSATATGLLFHGCLAFVLGGGGGAPTLLTVWILVPLFVSLLNWGVTAAYARWNGGRQPVVLLGDEATLERALEHLTRNPASPLDILDALAIDPNSPDMPRKGGLLATLKLCIPHYPSETVFLLGREGLSRDELNGLRDFVAESRLHASWVVSDTAGDGAERRATPGITFRSFSGNSFQMGALRDMAKRGVDIAVSCLALTILAPALAAVALVVRSDGGSVLIRQGRIGRHGRHYRCLRFRTMTPDADARLIEYLADHPPAAKEWRETRTLKDDPRRTRVGAFLERAGLDALPQLVNVLRGDMSLVGPKPISAEEKGAYGGALSHYVSMRPGMTGLWQVSARAGLPNADRQETDVWYTRNWSIWLDLWILGRTMSALVARWRHPSA